uniref:non-specific serine/threonine protein kinase n=1 Tax=Chrysotila carterae TaxID=13221 RepID=A0A7S4BV58_CHRCT
MSLNTTLPASRKTSTCSSDAESSNANHGPAASLREWLLDNARVSSARVEAVLRTCDLHEIDTVDDLRVHQRAGTLESLFPSTTALKIQEALNTSAASAAASTAAAAPAHSPSSSSSSPPPPPSDYEDVRQLGRGAFGTTWLALHRPSGRHVAIKRMIMDSMVEANQALQEILKMIKLKHTRLVEATDVSFDALGSGCYRVNIVMEYCDGGDLAQFLRRHAPLSEDDVVRFIRQTLEALQFIHSRGIVHRDVKPANMLLMRGDVKLGDLGLAKQVDAAVSSRGAAGTVGYMAPETFEGAAGTSADIWATAIMSTELASGVNATVATITEQQVASRLSLIPPTFSPAFSSAVASALVLPPSERPTADEMLLRPPFGSPLAGGPGVVTIDASALRAFLDEAAWMAPLRVRGLSWVPQPSGNAASHRVKLCEWASAAHHELHGVTAAGAAGEGVRDGVEEDVGEGVGAGVGAVGPNGTMACAVAVSTGSASFDEEGVAQPAAEAAARLHALVSAAPGNARFHELYTITKTVLCDCYGRSAMMASHAMDLNARLANRSLFSLSHDLTRGSDEMCAQRRRVLEYFQGTYPSLCRSCDGMDNVRVWIAFHAAPNESVALSVLRGNFAVLQRLDAGYYGQGIYLTLDADYAVEAYGRTVHQQEQVPLLVCAVAVGNMLPVVEMPRSPEGFMGKAMVGRADAHVSVVSLGVDPFDETEKEWYVPAPFEEWDAARTYTEIVVKDDSQVLPLGYLMVTPSDASDLLSQIAICEDEITRLHRASLTRAATLEKALATLHSFGSRAEGRAEEWRRRMHMLETATSQDLDAQLAMIAQLDGARSEDDGRGGAIENGASDSSPAAEAAWQRAAVGHVGSGGARTNAFGTNRTNAYGNIACATSAGRSTSSSNGVAVANFSSLGAAHTGLFRESPVAGTASSSASTTATDATVTATDANATTTANATTNATTTTAASFSAAATAAAGWSSESLSEGGTLSAVESLCVVHESDACAAAAWLTRQAAATNGWFEIVNGEPAPRSSNAARRRLRAAAERAEAQVSAEQLQTQEGLAAVRRVEAAEEEVAAAKADFDAAMAAARAAAEIEAAEAAAAVAAAAEVATAEGAREAEASRGEVQVITLVELGATRAQVREEPRL